MEVSQPVVELLQGLLKEFFSANAQSDNIAYWLGYNYYNKIEAIYHQSWAHAFPGDDFADGLSNFMLKVNIRPIRIGLPTFSTDYDSLAAAFVDNKKLAEHLLAKIHEVIDAAEVNGDVEVKLFAEDLAMHMITYVKQANEWVNAATNLSVAELNIHFSDYTNFIK